MPVSNVPEDITFGKKLLFIPMLEEMGIPRNIGELGYANLSSKLKGSEFSGGIWVERGENLLDYNFEAFNMDKSNFFEKITGTSHKVYERCEINSPISGLIIFFRDEYISSVNPHVNLVYHGVNRRLLPVILITNNESLPKKDNFYEYNSISRWLKYHFYRLPIRNRDSVKVERLKKHMSYSNWGIENYPKYLSQLNERNSDEYDKYLIREINSKDYELISNIENIRNNYTDLRSKLVHISREFGEFI